MAKSSSKVEDYWRQHNIENLFKELTQILTRRMPPDPAVALVEHLQKKFPKSFKASTDNIGIVPKTLANNLQLQSMTSPHSDVHNESIKDIQTERRSSTQSQASGIVTIPTVGSAFTDLLKQDTSSSRQAPELNLKNLVFANRLSQQVVKMGKDIRSDRDILEEELIKPIKTKSTANVSINTVSEDLQNAETHDEPSILQLIKYKQQIRIENDRRLHREKLAELAKSEREKEQFSLEISSKPEEISQQQTLSQVVPTETTSTKLPYKPIAKSKEEEDILNDENIFQSRKPRYRGRQKNKLMPSLTNTSYLRGRPTTDFRSSLRKDDGSLICKVCGNVLNEQENQSMVHSQQVSSIPITYSLEPQLSARSVEKTDDAVDDWFESASDVSSSRQLTPLIPNDTISTRLGSSTFRRNLFQPIKDNNTDTIEHQSPVRPIILSDDETNAKRFKAPNFFETGIFSRSPDSKVRSPPLSKNISSPVTIKHHTDTDAVTNRQSAKTLIQPSSARSTPSSTLLTNMASTNNRRMSGWSVSEHSPDDSD
ncbi:unnamed protein product [Rotaria sp. Silwood2]|nr:unnamed protein product [Rotaria sp. Silwood2]CAF3888271.1 unnamed protein product [Rotaria sp. Silwood2]CAF4052094.1 unnamed protein product [Rotaria sp. Silwood2]